MSGRLPGRCLGQQGSGFLWGFAIYLLRTYLGTHLPSTIIITIYILISYWFTHLATWSFVFITEDTEESMNWIDYTIFSTVQGTPILVLNHRHLRAYLLVFWLFFPATIVLSDGTLSYPSTICMAAVLFATIHVVDVNSQRQILHYWRWKSSTQSHADERELLILWSCLMSIELSGTI